MMALGAGRTYVVTGSNCPTPACDDVTSNLQVLPKPVDLPTPENLPVLSAPVKAWNAGKHCKNCGVLCPPNEQHTIGGISHQPLKVCLAHLIWCARS